MRRYNSKNSVLFIHPREFFLIIEEFSTLSHTRSPYLNNFCGFFFLFVDDFLHYWTQAMAACVHSVLQQSFLQNPVLYSRIIWYYFLQAKLDLQSLHDSQG